MEEVVFALSGERQTDNPIADELDGLLNREAPGSRHITLDLAKVEYISSVEVGTLISLHKASKEYGGRLTLKNLTSHTREVLKVCRLDTYLEIAD